MGIVSGLIIAELHPVNTKLKVIVALGPGEDKTPLTSMTYDVDVVICVLSIVNV